MCQKCMKQLLCIILLISSCDSPDKPADIVGTWKLAEVLADPGDGSGTFQPVNSEKAITFNPDNTFESSGTLCIPEIEPVSATMGTYDTDAMTISPNCGFQQTAPLRYEMSSNGLIIYFHCIEACAQKYRKI